MMKPLPDLIRERDGAALAVAAWCVLTVTVKVVGAKGFVPGTTGFCEKLHEANCGRFEQESVTGPVKPLTLRIPKLNTAGLPDGTCAAPTAA